ncbi:M48 family metalloprotease [Kribbella sp. NPDC050470]|uniref:M48 family metalloprotease n=1 Tax=unclassified Kribbella TaxID=2644121 RepID=UPI003797D632
MQSTEDVTNCPDCGHQIRVEQHYVTWCDQCDWNVDPAPQTDPTPAWRLRLEQRLADALYRELETGGIHRPGWDAARVAAYLLSALVLVLPLVALASGFALLIFYRPLWLSGPLALLAFAVAHLFRPRADKLPPDAQLLLRDQAPTLYGVLDRIADAIGAQKIAAVVVDAEPNMWFGRVGWRFRPVIGIGLPLWTSLSPQERLAVLAHELGHGRNGDAHHGWVIGAAESILHELRLTFSEQPLDRYRQDLSYQINADATYVGLITRLVNATVGGLVRGYGWLLDRAYFRGSQRAEYLADRRAAEVAGSEATAHALERLLLSDTAFRAMERVLRFGSEIDPLEAVRRAVNEVPKREIERRVRASRSRETRTDAMHPPTYLRTRLIRARPATHAKVVLGLDESRNVDRELAPPAQAVLAEFRSAL